MSEPMQGIRLNISELSILRGAARGLKAVARRRVRSVTAGQAKTVLRSRGMDYAESRAYQIGDDIRDIDWRVTARTGTTHTKMYEEEKHRPVLFAVDYSQTMQFGTKVAYKSVIAAQAITTLAWAAYNQRDNVGGMVFSEQGHEETKPLSGQRGIQRLLNSFVTEQPNLDSKPIESVEPPLVAALQRLALVARPGTLVAIASDFIGLADNEDALRAFGMLAQNCELILLNIRDPLEANLPAGAFAFSNLQDNQQSLYDLSSARTRKHYAEHYQQQQEQLEKIAIKYQAMLVNIMTNDDLPMTLHKYFGK